MNWLRATKGFFLSFIFLLIFVYLMSGTKSLFEGSLLTSASISEAVANIGNSIQNEQPAKVIQISPPAINAEAAISRISNLSDKNTILFEKDSNLKLPIASLTKLMTAVVILDNYNLESITIVSKQADLQNSINQDVGVGTKLSVESFLEIMLIKSSNKSAYALAEIMGEQKFVDAMNKKAKDLGLNDTFFADPTGLSSNNVSTAKDISNLAEYILKNYSKIAKISRSKELNIPGFGKIANTDQLLEEMPDAVFSKTGFTNDAKGCLLLVVNNQDSKDYLINVILGADDRFSEMRKLINWSSDAYSK